MIDSELLIPTLKPMKLCWLVPDDYWGGVYPVSLEVCRQAQLAGHDSHLLIVCKPAHAATSGSDTPIDSLNLDPNAPNAPTAIVNWLSEHDFDAVVLNCCSEADPVPPYLPESIRCIYVVHNSPRIYWAPAVQHAHQIDLVVAISDYVAGIVRPHIESPDQLVTIHNGSTFPPVPDLSLERPEDLLFLGGDEPRKGASDLLKVWNALVQLGFNGRLHWCGNLTDSFKAKIDALPAKDQIMLHGRIPREKVFQLASRCRVLLMLSRAEAFGMITIEAMSMGCLPVAWDVNTGTKEIAWPGKHGFFAPMGDYQALAKAAIEASAKQPSLAHQVVGRARTTFSAERMWADYQQCFSEMFKRPRSHRPLAGQTPPKHVPRLRSTQLLPSRFRTAVKQVLHNHPKVAYLLNRYWGT